MSDISKSVEEAEIATLEDLGVVTRVLASLQAEKQEPNHANAFERATQALRAVQNGDREYVVKKRRHVVAWAIDVAQLAANDDAIVNDDHEPWVLKTSRLMERLTVLLGYEDWRGCQAEWAGFAFDLQMLAFWCGLNAQGNPRDVARWVLEGPEDADNSFYYYMATAMVEVAAVVINDRLETARFQPDTIHIGGSR